MAEKKIFKIPADRILPLAEGRGACLASDRITVDGERVGYMYREEPDNDVDSGWRFLAGDESQDYSEDAEHFAYYDINTIANYDRDIIPLLASPQRSAFARDESGRLVPVAFEPSDDGSPPN